MGTLRKTRCSAIISNEDSFRHPTALLYGSSNVLLSEASPLYPELNYDAATWSIAGYEARLYKTYSSLAEIRSVRLYKSYRR